MDAAGSRFKALPIEMSNSVLQLVIWVGWTIKWSKEYLRHTLTIIEMDKVRYLDLL